MSYPYLILYAVLIFRLWELQYSWRLLQHKNTELLNNSLLLSLAGGLQGAWWVGSLLETTLLTPRFHAELVLPLLVVWALTLGLRFWAMLSMGPFWNLLLIKHKKQPVCADGPYRYIRHPHEVGLALEMAAVPLLVGAYATALLASLAHGWLLWRWILREEAHLLKSSTYRKVFAEKPRFIPKVF